MGLKGKFPEESSLFGHHVRIFLEKLKETAGVFMER